MHRIPPLALLAALAMPAAAQEGPNLVDTPSVRVDSFGYIRAGVGWQGGLEEPQTCFQLPGASAKYRLGNECEIYFEPGLRLEFGRPEQGPTVSVNLRASFIAFPLNDFDTELSFVEEAWVGLHGLGGRGGAGEGLTVWAGHRFYKRQDIHINDFYWWDATGLGGGVEGIDLDFASASVAYFVDSAGNMSGALDGTPYGRLDMRLEEIALSNAATLTLGLDFRVPDGGGGGPDPVNDGGGMATAQLGYELRERGTLTGALQVGWGAGRLLSYESDPRAEDGQMTVRLIGSHLWNASDRFSIQSGAVAEWREDDRDWLSLGARPVFGLGRDLYLAVEGGIDRVVPEAGDPRHLGKLTAALEWKPGPDFFSRPALRLYVTRGWWDEAAKAAGIAPGRDGLSGTNVGFQVEHFW